MFFFFFFFFFFFCLDKMSKNVDIKTTFVDIKIHTLLLWIVKNIEPQNMSINPLVFFFPFL